MKKGIDSLKTYKNWQKLYEDLSPKIKSPFFSPDYYSSYQYVERTEVECFWRHQDDHNYLFYPYLIKKINNLGYDLEDDYFDIQGAYGYNGPIGVVGDENFLREYNNSLKEYLEEKRVVTEFVRYCPIIGNRKYHQYTEQIDVLDNVFIDLKIGLKDIWDKSFKGTVRTVLRRSRDFNFETTILKGYEVDQATMEKCHHIYASTMTRRNADIFYFFDKKFFENLFKEMQEKVLLTITKYKGYPITFEIVLLDGLIAYSYLNGTLKEYYNLNANTYQRYEMIKFLIDQGYSIYSLGGGTSRGDRLYSFKKSFSRDCDNPFYIGTYVHNRSIYEQIVKQWQEKYPALVDKYENRVQCYRYVE
ncbi:MAG TPA: GNAT family N-acetyltransferase [Fermentimonas sp.]|nr:GNAT family N-acetyltransferase [Fermentimonas sp.]